MHKNRAWRAFLYLMAAATLYFCASAVYSVHYYYRLSAQTLPAQMVWGYREISADALAPVASYAFTAQGKMVSGETLLDEPVFRNEWAVDKVLGELKTRSWRVWYDPSNPSHSSLQKTFPFKEILSALALAVLFLYFIGLGIYVEKKFNSNG